MAYTRKQAKRIRKQYRRIVGPKPKGPKTMEFRKRRAAVKRGDPSFVNKAGKIVPLTRRKRLKTMERVIASGKKPVRRPVTNPGVGLPPAFLKKKGSGGMKALPPVKARGKPKFPKNPPRTGPAPARRRTRRKTR